MYVQIEKITADRTEAEFFEGYMWDTARDTRKAYTEAKKRHAVPFEEAAYLVDLYSFTDEIVDTFPLSEEGYCALSRSA